MLALNITIIEAFGTFIPTSITVVDINIFILLFSKFVIILFFSFGSILPCIIPILAIFPKALFIFSSSSLTLSDSLASSSSIIEATTYIWWFLSSSSFIIFNTSVISLSFLKIVITGLRLAGLLLIIDKSVSPYIVSAYVLGIGVALIDNTSGLIPLLLKMFLWFTPKRCCSSVITNPNFL